jgi:hypothetical protein
VSDRTPCEPGCSGWDFFEVNTGEEDLQHRDPAPAGRLQVQRCDSCDRFVSDEMATAHLHWIIGTGLRDQHSLAVLLLTSGGTARQWEELAG